ncbi:aminoglycoside adenylyltransferase domain-containing protein [Oceanobacillus jeddahense]|uniref:aminoglycoside adenylyltransferase domain-containing protein n=1 Tax=Oceanobacillus jeddahense TaxID=1462527 RepID=UPI0036271228
MEKIPRLTKHVQSFLNDLIQGIKQITDEQFTGCYLHGSLAMGSFQPENSDIDLLVVLNKALSKQQKQELAALFLDKSNHPYPIEISFLLECHLREWEHPFPYLFHYGEDWRERMKLNNDQVIEKNEGKDADLAAHIAVLLDRGVTLEGPPAGRIFPVIPKLDYISSIELDYKECLVNYIDKPVYCLLNMLRFYWYLKEECILSKKEAGERAYEAFPENMRPTIKSLLHHYQVKEADKRKFEKQELTALRDDIAKKSYKNTA